jgi:hypothetical protein
LVLWTEDNTPCVTEGGVDQGLCVQGICESVIEDSVLFFTGFDGEHGFDADEPWQIGDALPSLCSAQAIEDPPADVDMESGALAGLLIGECLPATPFAKSCLTSPLIELPFSGTVDLSYWEVVDLPQEVARGTIELFADGQWSEVHETSPVIPEWTEQLIPLGPVESPQIQLRFCFETSGELDSYSGWSVDNIELTCNDCAP